MTSGRIAGLALAMVVATTPATADIVRVTADRVEIRAAGDAESRVLGTASKGTLFEVLARENGWLRVLMPGEDHDGFVPAVLTAPVGEPTDGAPVPPAPSALSGDAPVPQAAAPVVVPDQAAGLSPGEPVTAATPAVASVSPGSAGKRKVLILQVADGKERSGDVAAGSGVALAAAIREALSARGVLPLVSEHASSMVEGVKEARELGYDNVLRVTITEWEDNATAWSAKSDAVAVSLELFDLTPALVSSAAHRKKGSRWAVTDSTPDRLLPELVKAPVRKLFADP